jgi:hypothetical protein
MQIKEFQETFSVGENYIVNDKQFNVHVEVTYRHDHRTIFKFSINFDLEKYPLDEGKVKDKVNEFALAIYNEMKK